MNDLRGVWDLTSQWLGLVDSDRAIRIILFTITVSVATATIAVHGGAVNGGDTGRYLDAANHLVRGELPTGFKQRSYLGFELVLAATMALTKTPQSVVFVNVLVCGLAAIAVFSIGERLFNRSTGLIAALLFALNIEISGWAGYVLTDSLYISSVVIATWSIVRAIGTRTRSTRWKAFVLVLVAALIRPNGWLLAPVFVAAAWGRRQLFICALAGALILATSSGPRAAIEAERPERSLIEGRVLWQSDVWRLSMPSPVSAHDSWIGGLRYVEQHPVATGRLAAARVAAELWHARPYFSKWHSVVVAAVYLPLYVFAITGLVTKGDRNGKRVIVSVIALHLLLVGATFADYDGRFLLYVIPLIGVLSAAGIHNVSTRPTGS